MSILQSLLLGFKKINFNKLISDFLAGGSAMITFDCSGANSTN
jgi:hypothetical protein